MAEIELSISASGYVAWWNSPSGWRHVKALGWVYDEELRWFVDDLKVRSVAQLERMADTFIAAKTIGRNSQPKSWHGGRHGHYDYTPKAEPIKVEIPKAEPIKPEQPKDVLWHPAKLIPPAPAKVEAAKAEPIKAEKAKTGRAGWANRKTICALFRAGYAITYIGRSVGVSMTTVYNILTLFGLWERNPDKPHAGRPKGKKRELTKKQQTIKKLYPDYSTFEIQAMTGLASSYINRMAKEHGWKHTPETVRRLRDNMARVQRTDEFRKAHSERMKEMWRKERQRAADGLPQQTCVRLWLLSQEGRKARTQLHINRGYIYAPNGDMAVMLYDEATSRADGTLPHTRKTEQWYTDTYGIRFMSVEEYNRQNRQQQ